MTKFTRKANGDYVIHGHSFEKLIGSRAQVMHGTAYKTTGGITKDKLAINKSGRIVSKSKSRLAKTQKHLQKSGWKLATKGHFGPQPMSSNKKASKSRRSRKHRGGNPLAPARFGGAGLTPAKFGGAALTPARFGGAALTPARFGGRSRSRHGGKVYGGPLSPQPYDGAGVKTSGVDLQFKAGNATGGSSRSRSRRGGMVYGGPLSPHAYDGAGVKTSGVNLQFVAGNAA
jgi:hypothetical protein